METRTVEKIMVPIDQYPHVPESMTLYEAIRVLGQYQIRNRDGQISSPRVLLVTDKDGQFVGILRRRDILRGLEPAFLIGGKVPHQRTAFDVQVDFDLSELSHDKMASGILRRARQFVHEVMMPIAATINHDDHLMKAMNEIVQCNTSILPVLKEGKVIGIVRTIDVMHEVRVMLDEAFTPES